MVHPNRQSPVNLYWAMAVSFFVAFLLMLIQLPQWLFYFRPDWVALVVIYWALMSPERIGPFTGFIIGLLLDVLTVSKFGVFGLGLATLAFIVSSISQQLRVLSLWQQMVLVGLLTGLFKLLTGWFYGMVSDFTISSEYWYSLISCMLVWPFVSILMQELRRLLRVR